MPLPTQIRVDIRDQFNPPDGQVQEGFKSLEDIIGRDVLFNVNWQNLWDETGELYPWRANFMTAVVSVLTTWCSVVAIRLQDDRFSDWSDEFKNKIEAAGSLILNLQPTDEPRPKTSFNSEANMFAVTLSKKTAVEAGTVGAGFETDLEDFFTPDAAAAAPAAAAYQPPSGTGAPGAGYAAPSADRIVPIPSGVASVSTVAIPASLPAVASIPRPDVLFASAPPYILHVTKHTNHPSHIVVYGTHEPSLKLLCDYLERWTKVDHSDPSRPPFVKVAMHQSIFGVGLTHDRLIIEPSTDHQNRANLNPMVVLGFVEGILGYRQTNATGGHTWEYRREAPFT
ncbi:hypothetical protein FQN57_004073 [Myotisia sp. PD_48]|nr:hypothetical protein FQN57_004073 [Myotisia sp. PD_48]